MITETHGSARQWVIATDVGGRSYLLCVRRVKGEDRVVWTPHYNLACRLTLADLGEYFSYIPAGFYCYEENILFLQK